MDFALGEQYSSCQWFLSDVLLGQLVCDARGQHRVHTSHFTMSVVTQQGREGHALATQVELLSSRAAGDSAAAAAAEAAMGVGSTLSLEAIARQHGWLAGSIVGIPSAAALR